MLKKQRLEKNKSSKYPNLIRSLQVGINLSHKEDPADSAGEEQVEFPTKFPMFEINK